MTWLVSYRGRDGALREERVEAADRVACVARCKARGIVPVSVKEGARKGSGAGRAASVSAVPRGRSRRAAVLAVAMLCVVGGGAWWWASGTREVRRPEAPKAAKVAKDIKVAKDLAPAEAPKGPTAIPPVAAGDPPPAVVAPRAIPPPDEATNAAETAESRPPAPERVFKTDAEALLAMATPPEPGMDVPPLPPFSEETTSNSAERALASVAQATSNDTERTIGAKIVVEEQKEELRALMKEGWTFAEYLAALHKKHTDDAAYLREAQRLDRELRDDASVSNADYAAYRKKIDAELRERGLPGLTEAEKKAEAEKEAGK